MSVVKQNLITDGLSGKIDKEYTFVRMRNGKTLLRRIPSKPIQRTAAQKSQSARFRLAILRAKIGLADAAERAVLEQQMPEGGNLFGTAVKYYYHESMRG